MTFQEMFDDAKKMLVKAKKVDAAAPFAVQVNVTGEGSGIFYVKSENGALAVEPFDYMDHDAVMTVDSAALLNSLKTAETEALPLEGNAEKIAAFRAVLTSLPKPRKAAAKTTAAAKSEPAAKPAPKKAAAPKATEKKVEKPAAAPKKAAAAKTAATKTTASKTTAAKKTTKK